VSGVTIAPALSSTPSMPSVSAASTWTPGSACSAIAQPIRNSVARPPRPGAAPSRDARTVTVVSPPDRMTHGLRNGSPRRATARAMAAWTRPTTCDSPSISSLRMCASSPASRATRAAASSDCCGVAIMCTSWPSKRRSPGFGVSNAPLSSPSRAAFGTSMP
jgi:hypothetical protein